MDLLKATPVELRELIDTDPANTDIAKRLPQLNPAKQNVMHYLILDGLKIAAAMTLKPDSFHVGGIAIGQISVDPDYRGQKLAHRLGETLFKVARQTVSTIDPGIFTEDGNERLKGMLVRLHRDNPDVKIHWQPSGPPIDGSEPYTVVEQDQMQKVIPATTWPVVPRPRKP